MQAGESQEEKSKKNPKENENDREKEMFPEAQPCACDSGAGSGRTKVRQEKEYKDLLNRLNRIEGQIRGIKGMVEKNAYCTDILTQVAAVSSALDSFGRILLGNHIRGCVTTDIREGREDAVDELLDIIQKMMK